MQSPPSRRLFVVVLLACAGSMFFSLLPTTAIAAVNLQELARQAEAAQHEADWRKACLLYQTILVHRRDFPGARAGYFHCLRRWYQTLRHCDPSFEKDVLSLSYGQAMQFCEYMMTYLLDNSVQHGRLTAQQMFRKGLKEFDYALTNETFVFRRLKGASAEKVQAFRQRIRQRWAHKPVKSVREAANLVREVARQAARQLKLRPNITVMEITCGCCYAVDDYTMYLTPLRLQRLCRSLKGEFNPGVYYEMKEESVGYLKITDFSETTIADVDDALVSMDKMNLKGLIIDLRGNDGGLVEAAVEVARRFLVSGVIVTVEMPGAKDRVVHVARNPDAMEKIPLVVLVNGRTASAAEILAGALKENNRARLIGKTTFGKGCIQELYRLAPRKNRPFPGGLRLTVARFLSPTGVPYTGRGVVPHLLVESSPQADDQLETALEEVRQAIMILQ